jgi:hypothetical protein
MVRGSSSGVNGLGSVKQIFDQLAGYRKLHDAVAGIVFYRPPGAPRAILLRASATAARISTDLASSQ